jgi:hypothetical protein
MATYTIKSSLHGPVIFFEEDMYFITEKNRIFDLLDELPNLIFDINEAVSAQLESQSAILVDSLKKFNKQDPSDARAAIDAVQNYHRLIYSEYPEYRAQVAEAVLGDRKSESLQQLNPPHINKFYELLMGGSVQ